MTTTHGGIRPNAGRLQIVLPDDKQQFILDNYKTIKATDMAIELNVPYQYVTKFLVMHNLNKRAKKGYGKRHSLTKEQEKYILDNYNGRNGEEFARRFSLSIWYIDDFRKKNGLIRSFNPKAKVIKVNDGLFNVDSEINWVA